MTKAQVTIEFLTYSIIFLIAMGVMLAIIVLLGNDQIQLQKYNVVKGLTKEIASSLVFTLSMAENFEYKINIDRNINGQPYLIYLKKSSSASPLRGKGVVVVQVGDVVDDSNALSYSVVIPAADFVAGRNVDLYSSPTYTGVYINTSKIDGTSIKGVIVFTSSTLPGKIEVSLE